jgi:hypothetical protein
VGALEALEVLGILHNPIYAGAYVFGRSEERTRLIDGQLRRRYKKRLPQAAWRTCLREHHPGYIGWDEFMATSASFTTTAPTSACQLSAAPPAKGMRCCKVWRCAGGAAIG